MLMGALNNTILTEQSGIPRISSTCMGLIFYADPAVPLDSLGNILVPIGIPQSILTGVKFARGERGATKVRTTVMTVVQDTIQTSLHCQILVCVNCVQEGFTPFLLARLNAKNVLLAVLLGVVPETASAWNATRACTKTKQVALNAKYVNQGLSRLLGAQQTALDVLLDLWQTVATKTFTARSAKPAHIKTKLPGAPARSVQQAVSPVIQAAPRTVQRVQPA